MLTIRNFIKRYGANIVLEIDTLTLLKGVYLFKGKNGSGKTTLFKSIAGITPCQGDVSLDDQTNLLRDSLQFRRFVNYCEAEPIYPGFLTPIELMNFVGSSKDANDDQQKELLKMFGIHEYHHKPFSACSSGMVKKLALSLAFLGKPKVIILDEPLITLDNVSRDILVKLIKSYVEDYGITCLMSSHQELDDDALPLAGTYLIHDRRIVAV